MKVIQCPTCNELIPQPTNYDPSRYNPTLHDHEHRLDFTHVHYSHPIDAETNNPIPYVYNVHSPEPVNYNNGHNSHNGHNSYTRHIPLDRPHDTPPIIYATIHYLLAPPDLPKYRTTYNNITFETYSLFEALHQIEQESLKDGTNLKISNWSI